MGNGSYLGGSTIIGFAARRFAEGQRDDTTSTPEQVEAHRLKNLIRTEAAKRAQLIKKAALAKKAEATARKAPKRAAIRAEKAKAQRLASPPDLKDQHRHRMIDVEVVVVSRIEDRSARKARLVGMRPVSKIKSES